MSAQSDGQSLVELTLMLPVLMLLLLGMIDLGRVYYLYVTMTNAAREGARFGAVNPDDSSGIRARVVQEASNTGVDLSSATIQVACFTEDGSSSVSCTSGVLAGDQIKVTVTTSFQFMTTYLFGVGSINVSNFAVMAITT